MKAYNKYTQYICFFITHKTMVAYCFPFFRSQRVCINNNPMYIIGCIWDEYREMKLFWNKTHVDVYYIVETSCDEKIKRELCDKICDDIDTLPYTTERSLQIMEVCKTHGFENVSMFHY